MNAKDARDVATKLAKKPEMAPFWDPTALEIWLRCDGYCVYCDRDMLASRGITYFFSVSKEHLLPFCDYPKLEKESSNLVLSCRPCNALKGQWDPNKYGGEVYTGSDGSPLTDEQRQELISRVRQHIDPLRKKQDDDFPLERKLILEALGENPSTREEANLGSAGREAQPGIDHMGSAIGRAVGNAVLRSLLGEANLTSDQTSVIREAGEGNLPEESIGEAGTSPPGDCGKGRTKAA